MAINITGPCDDQAVLHHEMGLTQDLGISESGLRRWMAQADVDEGKREGLTTAEKEELTRLRRENRVLRMERDLLSRAAAFFAQENVLPK